MHINHRLEVDLGDRSYPIYIGTELLGSGEIIKQHIHGRSALTAVSYTHLTLPTKIV